MNRENISLAASSVSGALPQVIRGAPSDEMTSENPSPQVSLIILNDENFEDESRTSESSPSQENTGEDVKSTDMKYQDCQIQKEIDEMNRLDLILSEVLLEEKQIKLQGEKNLKKLWSELMDIPRTFESTVETENTRLFLALDAPQDFKAEAYFEPTFKTQCADEDEISIEEQSKKNMAHSTKGEDPPLSQRDTPQCKKRKSKDFVKRNAELAGATGGPFRMTPAEKERLTELLEGIDEAENRSVGGPGNCQGDAWVSSLPTRHWFTPEPAELDQQRYINHQLSLLGPLCPVDHYYMMETSFFNGSISEVQGVVPIRGDTDQSAPTARDASALSSLSSLHQASDQEPGWEVGGRHWASIGGAEGFDTVKIGNALPTGDSAAGREIPQRLSPEQLHDLLEECEQSQRSHPRPPISRAMLAALLRDPYTSSFTFQDQAAANS